MPPAPSRPSNPHRTHTRAGRRKVPTRTADTDPETPNWRANPWRTGDHIPERRGVSLVVPTGIEPVTFRVW